MLVCTWKLFLMDTVLNKCEWEGRMGSGFMSKLRAFVADVNRRQFCDKRTFICGFASD
jgi:hypothetical protein